MGISRRKITLISTSIWAIPARSSAPIALRYSVSIRAWEHTKLIRQIVLTVTWSELKAPTPLLESCWLQPTSAHASAMALAKATDASSADRYLSVLPSALLLEQISGIYAPLSVGAQIHLPWESPGRSGNDSIAAAAQEGQVTVTVLVPELLAAWLRQLQAMDRSGPSSLRYVAVGGAPISRQLAAAAWEQGLPVHEGYGLSECCSVVSLNRPGDRRVGTVGRPLPGVQVTIDNGEIVVSGPTVMKGYLTASGSERDLVHRRPRQL